MKVLLTLFTSLCLTMGIVSTADAKRFGSGGFGKSFQTTPYKKSTPASPQKQDQAKPAAGRGMLGGLMGGLLAGGLFAWLLGSGAFEGIQFMDILLIGLVLFVIFRLMRSGAGARQQREAWAAAGNAAPQQFESSAMTGGSDGGVPMNLPEGFEADAFVDGALQHYREVQQAWNSGDLSTIAEYVSPELYTALARQRQAMMVPPQTEIVDLSAEIVRADRTTEVAEISVLFRGLVRDELEKSEDGVYDIWHLQRDLSKDGAPWLIVGIQAE